MSDAELVASVEPFIKSAARRSAVYLYAGGVDYEDLVCVGRMAALHAARRYNPGRGARFMTYAIRWIRQAIRRAVEHSHLVYLPERRQRLAQKKQERMPNAVKLSTRSFITIDLEGYVDLGRFGRMVDSLPEPEKSVIRLQYWEDLSLEEIAQRMGTYAERVRRMRERGLEQLRVNRRSSRQSR